MIPLRLVVALALSLLPAAVSNAQCLRYSVEFIEVCQDGLAVPLALSEDGAVAGYFVCGISPNDYPLLWAGREPVWIPLPAGYSNARGYDVIDGPSVVGWMDGSEPRRGFLYADGSVTSLPVLPGHHSSTARAIAPTPAQTVVGYSANIATGPQLAVRWVNGAVSVIEVSGGPNSEANDINANGDVCGWMGEAWTTDATGFLWTEKGTIDMGKPPGAIVSIAVDLNDLGDAVGSYRMPVVNGFQPRFPFLWTDGAMQDLGLLPGCTRGYAEGINNCGEVVGYCEASFGQTFGYVWKDGIMTKLDDLLVAVSNLTVTIAYDINDAGQITGKCRTLGRDSQTVAVLLTPVPPLFGDIDCDGSVGGSDLSILLGQWGGCAPDVACASDVDGDGEVAAGDLAVLLGAWTG